MATPERRATVFPGNSIVTVPRKRSLDEESSRLSASKIPKVPEFKNQERQHPPALPIKVRSDSNQYRHQNRRVPAPRQLSSPIQRAHPWEKYRAILKESQGDPFTLAHEVESRHEIVAVWERKCVDTTRLSRLTRYQHANLVTLYTTFLHNDTLHFMCEPMDVTLAEVQATPVGAFEAYQISAVCLEVLQGLQFIHSTLKVIHGRLSAETILLNRDGQVKIGHIGPAILEAKSVADSGQIDLRAVGCLMVRLMELGTSMMNPQSLILEKPDRWDEPTKAFLAKTGSSSIDELLKDDFLKKSPGTSFFRPLVLITERSIHRESRILIR